MLRTTRYHCQNCGQVEESQTAIIDGTAGTVETDISSYDGRPILCYKCDMADRLANHKPMPVYDNN